MAKHSPNKTEGPIALIDPVENEWKGLFVITEHWKSDLQFFADEMRFLKKLIDKYFVWLINEKNIQRNSAMSGQLSKQKKDRDKLEQKVNDHLHHLTNLIENPFPHNAQECRDEHADIEVLFTAFLKEFRLVKKEIFQLTEDVLDSEQGNVFDSF